MYLHPTASLLENSEKNIKGILQSHSLYQIDTPQYILVRKFQSVSYSYVYLYIIIIKKYYMLCTCFLEKLRRT